MASHSNILAWEIAWTEEPDRLWSMKSQKKSDTTQQLNNNTDYVLNCIVFFKFIKT